MIVLHSAREEQRGAERRGSTTPESDVASAAEDALSPVSGGDRSTEDELAYEGSYFVLYGQELLGDTAHDDKPLDVLLNLLARTSTELAASGGTARDSVLEVLKEHPDPIFRRVELRLLADDGEQQAMRITALLDELCRDTRMRIFWPRDTAYFLRGAWPHADAATRLQFAAQLAAVDREHVADFLTSFSGTTATDEDIDDFIRRAQRRSLQLFGRALPAELRELALACGFDPTAPGADELPDEEVGVSMTSGHGAVSPLEDAQLYAMNPAELIDYAVAWRPTSDDRRGPSVEGLGISLSQYVRRLPEQSAPLLSAKELMSVPTFAAGVFGGFRGAFRQQQPIPWVEVIAAVSEAAAFRDEGDGRQRSRHSVHSVLTAAADLIEAGADGDAFSNEAIERAWAAIDAIVSNPATQTQVSGHSDPETAHGAYTAVDGSIVVSHYSVLSRVTEAAIHLALCGQRAVMSANNSRGHERSDEGSRGRVPSVEERRAIAAPLFGRLDQWLRLPEPHATSVETVIGMQLPTLVWMNADWVTMRREDLLLPREQSSAPRPAWLAYLASSRLYRDTYELLRTVYANALARTAHATKEPPDRVAERSERYRLAAHVVEASMHGWSNWNDNDRLLRRTINRTPAAELGSIYGLIGRGIRDAARNDPSAAERLTPIASRMAAFWEWRLNEFDRPSGSRNQAEIDAELSGLGWFFQMDLIDDQVALALLARTVNRAKSLGQVIMLWWPRLARLAPQYPSLVLSISLVLVEGHARKAPFRVQRAELREIVRVGLANVHDEVVQEARRLANLLGERGDDTMLALLSNSTEIARSRSVANEGDDGERRTAANARAPTNTAAEPFSRD